MVDYCLARFPENFTLAKPEIVKSSVNHVMVPRLE
jgi:hypothetical protein